MRWKHTWMIKKKKKTNETTFLFTVWGFTAFKLSSDILSKMPYVCPLTLIGVSHPHSPPAECYGGAAPSEVEGFYVGLQGFSPCGQPATSLETLALPATSRLGWNTMLKDIGVGFLSAFKGGGVGVVRWDRLEVWGSKSSGGWILANVPSFLEELLQGIFLLHLRCSVCSCGWSCQVIGGAPLWVHTKQWSMWQCISFSFFSLLSVSFPFALTFNALGLYFPNKAPVLNPGLRLCILGNWVSNAYFILDSVHYFEAKNVIFSHTLKIRKLRLKDVKWLNWDFIYSFVHEFIIHLADTSQVPTTWQLRETKFLPSWNLIQGRRGRW